jgi:hypothetical protein
MTSQLAVRLGSQVPVILHQPPGVVSLDAAEEAIELADAYGICDGFPLSESQKVTLRNALGTREDGKWAASRVANFGPRQGTGKNDAIAARELAGLILFGEQLIIHTAHEFPTANESFRRLVAVFDNWDDLRKRVAHIYYANGNQSIEFLNGARILYKTRTGGGMRGFAKAGLIVYDEAQHLQSEHAGASAPARLTNPNSQTWYAGSGGLATSQKAWSMRREAVEGRGGRLAYTEWTAETVEIVDGQVVFTPPVDPLDPDVWYRCMPGLGRWVSEESVEDLRDDLKELFPREGLCVWEPDPTNEPSVFGPGVWAACCSPDYAPGNDIAFGVDVSPEREEGHSAIVVCDNAGTVEVIDTRPGVSWLTQRVMDLARNHRGAAFVVDSASPAHSFADEWQRAGVVVQRLTSREMAGACGTFLDAVLARNLKVKTDAALDRAAAGVRKRVSGDIWYWARKDNNTDVTPIIAASIARWAAIGPSVYAARGMRVI